MSKPVREVKCPTCGAAVPWQPESRWRPFCSERCRMMDLGAWASNQYRVAGPPVGEGEHQDGDSSGDGR